MKKRILITTVCLSLITCYCSAKNLPADTALKVYKDPQITEFFKRETGWIAGDGGYTIPLENNKVLWTFGDTFTNDYDKATDRVPCIFNVRNVCMLQPLNNWDWHQTETILTPQKTTLFNSNPTPGYFNWPGAGVQIRDTAYVFCFNLKNSSENLGFAYAGVNVFAKIKIPEMKVVGYHNLQDMDGISFACGMIKDTKDGYVYVYGSKASLMTTNMYVARFPISDPNAKWTFWNGKGWDNNIKKIAVITNTFSQSVNVVKVKNKYLMFSSEFSLGCDQGKEIYVQAGNNLTGPFSKKKVIYTIDDTREGHYPFFYLAIAHPEYINNKNELLLTYSINGYGKCVPACVDNKYNPDFYRPRGIRIPLKLIDPSL